MIAAQWVQAGVGALTFLLLALNYGQSRSNRGGIDDVHKLVDGRATRQEDRIDQLTATIAAAPNVDVPDRTQAT